MFFRRAPPKLAEKKAVAFSREELENLAFTSHTDTESDNTEREDDDEHEDDLDLSLTRLPSFSITMYKIEKESYKEYKALLCINCSCSQKIRNPGKTVSKTYMSPSVPSNATPHDER